MCVQQVLFCQVEPELDLQRQLAWALEKVQETSESSECLMTSPSKCTLKCYSCSLYKSLLSSTDETEVQTQNGMQKKLPPLGGK